MSNRNFEVKGKFRKRGAVVLSSFGTRLEALAFARDAADNYVEPESRDPLLSITVVDRASNETLSTFYPERYEAESLDDDDDG